MQGVCRTHFSALHRLQFRTMSWTRDDCFLHTSWIYTVSEINMAVLHWSEANTKTQLSLGRPLALKLRMQIGHNGIESCTCRVQNPDIPRAGRGGSGQGGAWPGRKRRRGFGSPRKHLSFVHTRVTKTTVPIGSTNSLTCRTKNPDTLRAGRVGAAHGGAARGGGAG